LDPFSRQHVFGRLLVSRDAEEAIHLKIRTSLASFRSRTEIPFVTTLQTVFSSNSVVCKESKRKRHDICDRDRSCHSFQESIMKSLIVAMLILASAQTILFAQPELPSTKPSIPLQALPNGPKEFVAPNPLVMEAEKKNKKKLIEPPLRTCEDAAFLCKENCASIKIPFCSLPCIVPITDSCQVSGTGKEPCKDPASKGADDGCPGAVQKPCCCAVFHQAAHFPLPRFAGQDEHLPGEGVVIYEGMKFSANRQGDFELGIVLSTVGMPVTLRMQLAFCDDKESPSTWMITLPPIVIEPPMEVRGNYKGSQWRVSFNGYSAKLGEALTDCNGKLCITRHGTARFGALPVVGYP
jgi:hypothetical protein